ncbi:hypothetical protein F2P81_018965 [Scophthalmus maximus]|uniref:Uncharacterized protein n=1 Tax=Scophthalmus maximus TaxID=52904 RepID=A0A6A4SDJ7_SCOMX|nr:hypothetical protein F2P81_018965 [Scophthalmus maximus]
MRSNFEAIVWIFRPLAERAETLRTSGGRSAVEELRCPDETLLTYRRIKKSLSSGHSGFIRCSFCNSCRLIFSPDVSRLQYSLTFRRLRLEGHVCGPRPGRRSRPLGVVFFHPA